MTVMFQFFEASMTNTVLYHLPMSIKKHQDKHNQLKNKQKIRYGEKYRKSQKNKNGKVKYFRAIKKAISSSDTLHLLAKKCKKISEKA